MNQKNQKGITLIALVITIIVLLILAGVTISMVLGDDGIISQAQSAKEAQANAEQKEDDAIRAGEGGIDQYKEGTLANAAYKGEVKVGDYVSYTYTGGEYTVKAEKSGDTEATEQTFKSGSGENMNLTHWRVISTEGGVIKITPEFTEWKDAAGNVDKTRNLTLLGEQAIVNGPTILNEMCATLYSGPFGTARSLNVDDILELFDISDSNCYRDTNGQPVIVEENTTLEELEKTIDHTVGVKRKVPGGGKIENIKVNHSYINTIDRYLRYNFDPSQGANFVGNSDNEEGIKLYEILVKNENQHPGSSYWLASTFNDVWLKPEYNRVYYRIAMIQGGNIQGYWTCTSEDDESRAYDYQADNCVRPIVILNSGIMLDTSNPEKDGSEPAKAWVIK